MLYGKSHEKRSVFAMSKSDEFDPKRLKERKAEK